MPLYRAMAYLILWGLGFVSFWAGLALFDDEILLIACALVGSGLIIAGLVLAPPRLQIAIEIVLVLALFRVCMKCIERGSLS